MASSQHQQASAAFATLIATGRQDRNTGAIQAGLDIGTPLLRPAQQSVADRAARWASPCGGAGGIRTHTVKNLNLAPPAVGLRPLRPGGAAAGSRRGQTPSSWRSRATWPVALTAYCAFSIFPSGSTTKVDLMTPTDFFP